MKDGLRYKRRKAEERRLALEKEKLARDRQVDMNSSKEEQAVKKMKELDDLRLEKERLVKDKIRQDRDEKMEFWVPLFVLVIGGLITVLLWVGLTW